MRKLFSPNGAFTNKAVIVGAALAVVHQYIASKQFKDKNHAHNLEEDVIRLERK